MRFLMDHWEWIIGPGVVLLASILNLVTQHYGDAAPKLKRALLFAVDLLSLVVSRGAVLPAFQPQGLRLKLPLVQVSPPTEAMLRSREAGVKVQP